MNDILLALGRQLNLTVYPHDRDGFHVEAAGLAHALGFREAFTMIRNLPDMERGIESWSINNYVCKGSLYVTERGCYRAIAQRQPKRIANLHTRAKVERQQSWIFGLVLPQAGRIGLHLDAPSFAFLSVPSLPSLPTQSYVRRERAEGLPPVGSTADRIRIAVRDEWICGICREPIDPELTGPNMYSVSVDHIIPRSAGGGHEDENLQITHLGCNIRKSNKWVAPILESS